jgi:hypothetical protein
MKEFSLWKKISGILMLFVVVILYRDVNHIYELDRFRSSDTPFKAGLIAEIPSQEGLSDLHISGSGRPTQTALKLAFKTLNMPIFVVDLFAEDHYYLNGYPEE